MSSGPASGQAARPDLDRQGPRAITARVAVEGLAGGGRSWGHRQEQASEGVFRAPGVSAEGRGEASGPVDIAELVRYRAGPGPTLRPVPAVPGSGEELPAGGGQRQIGIDVVVSVLGAPGAVVGAASGNLKE